MAENKSPFILYLPKWYPSRLDPQLGIFIQKHAKAVAGFRRVIVLSVQGDAQAEKKIGIISNEQDGLTEYIVYFRKAGGVAGQFLNFLSYIKSVSSGVQKIIQQQGRPDLVHAHVLLRPALVAYLISRRFHIPFILSEHWTGFIHGGYRQKSVLYKRLCRAIVKRADALTVVSVGLHQAMALHKVMNSNTHVIPNVIDRPLLPSTLVRKDDRIRVLTVADLVEKNKNVSGAIRAMAEIREKHPNLEYHIIGGGEDEAFLHKLAGELNKEKQWIFFYGRRDNVFVLDFLFTIDFLLTNSNIETFSVITAEALAAGKPVIATRSGGPEYFVSKGNGILITPGDHGQLVEALETMIITYGDYPAGEIAREISKRFGPGIIGHQFDRLYETLISKSNV